MNKPSALPDKSLFELICGQTVRPPDYYFGHICQQYQLVLPPVLIEEVLTNIVEPQGRSPALINEMAKQIVRFAPCWMDDIIEMAFKELVLKEHISRLSGPTDELLRRLFDLNKNDPELVAWVHNRKATKKEIIRQRKDGQDKLVRPDTRLQLSSEGSFFHYILQKELLPRLENAAEREELLGTILGGRFQILHEGYLRRVEEAFQTLTPEAATKHPVTLGCLLARFAYCIGPCVEIYDPQGNEAPREILERKSKKQRNNLEDEEYVASALVCARLLTADGGMRKIAQIFKAAGFWKGQVIYIDPDPARDLDSQIPHLLV